MIAKNTLEKFNTNQAKGLKYYEPKWTKRRQTTKSAAPGTYDFMYNVYAET